MIPTNEQDIREFVELVGRFEWRNDFRAFCRVLGIEPGTADSAARWQGFKDLVQGLRRLDAGDLARIVNHERAA